MLLGPSTHVGSLWALGPRQPLVTRVALQCRSEKPSAGAGQDWEELGGGGTEAWPCATVSLYQPSLWVQPKDPRVRDTRSTPGHVPCVHGGPSGAGVLPCLACPGDRRQDSEHSKFTDPTARVPLPISPALCEDEHALTLLPASPGTPSCPSRPTSPWGEKRGDVLVTSTGTSEPGAMLSKGCPPGADFSPGTMAWPPRSVPPPCRTLLAVPFLLCDLSALGDRLVLESPKIPKEKATPC